MFKQYWKSIVRSVWNSRTVTLINIVGLSVGMTAAAFILVWVQNEITYDRDQPYAKNIYRATSHLTVSKGDTWVWEDTPYPIAYLAKQEIPGIERVARVRPKYGDNIIFQFPVSQKDPVIAIENPGDQDHLQRI